MIDDCYGDHIQYLHTHTFVMFKVGYNRDGQITAIKCSLYSNGGNTVDASFWVRIKTVLLYC